MNWFSLVDRIGRRGRRTRMPPISRDVDSKWQESRKGNEKAHRIHVEDVTPITCVFVYSLRIKLISSPQAIVMAVSLNV